MVLKLHFQNPLYVSVGSQRDVIVLQINPLIFRSATDGASPTPANTIIRALIPPQMQSEKEFFAAQESVNTSRNGMDFGILITLGAQLFFSMSMNLIWGILNALQLVTNLKRMESIQTPGKVILLLETIDSTVNLKIHEQPLVKAAMQEYTESIYA